MSDLETHWSTYYAMRGAGIYIDQTAEFTLLPFFQISD